MDQIVTIIGGSGFIGRYVVRRLAKAGYRLRVVCRRPDAALHLKTAGDVGQITLMRGDMMRPETIAPALEHAYAVINLSGVLVESSRCPFMSVHARGPERLAQMAKAAHVQRFIHVSALGVDKAAGSRYARSKLLGEKAVLAAFPEALILRPSVIFGPEDNFINQFAQMAALAPALPLIGGGATLFQPVYVDDVAAAIQACLTLEEGKHHIFELGGPQTLSFKQILEYILRQIGKSRPLVPLPFSLAAVIGAFGEWLPRPPLTRDQVRLLRFDNVVSAGARTLAHLGIKPTPMEAVVPGYLARFGRPKQAAA